MNRRMPNGTYGGVRGWGREAPAYSIRVRGEDREKLARPLKVIYLDNG
jgi:hypothetical protein